MLESNVIVQIKNKRGKGRKTRMKIRYISGPQSLDIKLEGISRKMGVEFVMEKLMGLDVAARRIVYADDMLLSMVPFYEQGALLMCPSNAREEAKKIVRESGGFVSEKRSTEAVVEFLTQIYPSEYRDKHRFIHSIYFDKDGVVWEAERLEQNLPFFKIIADYIKNCEGPYTAHPPISIATGASRASVSRVLDYIQLNRENIPVKFHRENIPLVWPPVIFEEGCLALDPVTGTGNTFDLTEEKYGLFPRDLRELILLIVKLGEEINKRVPAINKQLGQNCKIVSKERSGYTLDLPFGIRGSRDNPRRAHSLIYRNIQDLIPKDMEFAGLFTEQELKF